MIARPGGVPKAFCDDAIPIYQVSDVCTSIPQSCIRNSSAPIEQTPSTATKVDGETVWTIAVISSTLVKTL
jgi:hypothetical protein